MPAHAEEPVVAALRAAGCVFAEEEARLLLAAAETEGELAALVARRVAGEPLEHLLGWAEFCGLRIEVDAGVFVPRRRTELLVRQATARVAPGAVAVDLCCGSGAVGLALATMSTDLDLHAADVDPVAVACARRNVAAVGGRVYEGDLFDALPAVLRGGVDVVVANVPYVPSDAVAWMPPEARDHEPLVALDGGADGLEVARRMISGAPAWLAPRGFLLFETSQGQVPVAAALVAAGGFRADVVTDEELGATVVVGTPR